MSSFRSTLKELKCEKIVGADIEISGSLSALPLRAFAQTTADVTGSTDISDVHALNGKLWKSDITAGNVALTVNAANVDVASDVMGVVYLNRSEEHTSELQSRLH